jgi:hypothetical protein
VTGVDAQLYVKLYGLVELGGSGLADEGKSVLRLILYGAVNLFRALLIFLTSEQSDSSS